MNKKIKAKLTNTKKSFKRKTLTQILINSYLENKQMWKKNSQRTNSKININLLLTKFCHQ